MKETGKFEWPNGCEVAVSLTFDDGLASQLNFAVPLLNELGFKATFYLNPREDYIGGRLSLGKRFLSRVMR